MPVNIGLPPIRQGGFDLDSIIKLAALMNQMSEQEALYGTPGKPTTKITPGTPAIPARPENRPAPYQLPGVGPVYGQDALIAPEPRTMPGIGPVLPATKEIPGTPDLLTTEITGGTPGLKELSIKADLATQGLLSPESLQETFTTRGFEKTKFAVGKGSRVLYNPFSPDIVPLAQAESIPKESRNQYVEMTEKDASLEVGKWVRQKMAGGAQTQSEMMRLYSELNDLKARYIPLRPAQKDLLNALELELSQRTGVKGAVNIVTQAREKRESAYQAYKAKASNLIRQNLDAKISRSERRRNLQGILNDVQSHFEDEDFYDLDVPEAKNKFLRGE